MASGSQQRALCPASGPPQGSLTPSSKHPGVGEGWHGAPGVTFRGFEKHSYLGSACLRRGWEMGPCLRQVPKASVKDEAPPGSNGFQSLASESLFPSKSIFGILISEENRMILVEKGVGPRRPTELTAERSLKTTDRPVKAFGIISQECEGHLIWL